VVFAGATAAVSCIGGGRGIRRRDSRSQLLVVYSCRCGDGGELLRPAH
jgi:hypothetical protein